MRKFEFVEESEITPKGEITMYYTTFCEGDSTPRFIPGSMFSDKTEARKMFELIVKNNGKLVKKTVLKTIEV